MDKPRSALLVMNILQLLVVSLVRTILSYTLGMATDGLQQ